MNAKSIENFRDEKKMDELGRQVAEFVAGQIKNMEQYDKIEVSFAVKDESAQRMVKQNIFYRFPGFEVTSLFR